MAVGSVEMMTHVLLAAGHEGPEIGFQGNLAEASFPESGYMAVSSVDQATVGMAGIAESYQVVHSESFVAVAGHN